MQNDSTPRDVVLDDGETVSVQNTHARDSPAHLMGPHTAEPREISGGQAAARLDEHREPREHALDVWLGYARGLLREELGRAPTLRCC